MMAVVVVAVSSKEGERAFSMDRLSFWVLFSFPFLGFRVLVLHSDTAQKGCFDV